MGQLKAGAAKANITPYVGINMSGFGNRTKPSVGVHDDLYAKALVLDDATTQIGIVSCDLLNLDESSITSIREKAQELTEMDGENTNEIVGDFGALGIWLYHGIWTKISGGNPEELVALDLNGDLTDEIVGDFSGLGIYLYNGSSWSKISSNNAEKLFAGDINGDGVEELIGDFGSQGLWSYDGTWSRIVWNNPEDFICADINNDGTDEIIGDFGSNGLWWR